MSRINRTSGVGEKASSIPFKNSLTVGTKNILISVHLSSLKKAIKPPWHHVVGLLRMRWYGKAISAHSDVTKSHIKPCDTHTSTHMAVHMWGSDEKAEPLEP